MPVESARSVGEKGGLSYFYCIHSSHYSTMLAGGLACSAVESYACTCISLFGILIPTYNLSDVARFSCVREISSGF